MHPRTMHQLSLPTVLFGLLTILPLWMSSILFSLSAIVIASFRNVPERIQVSIWNVSHILIIIIYDQKAKKLQKRKRGSYEPLFDYSSMSRRVPSSSVVISSAVTLSTFSMSLKGSQSSPGCLFFCISTSSKSLITR